MAQTLLAVAAVIVLGLFGLSRHRALAADDRADLGRAVEDAALQVSERWGGAVRDLAFDEADVTSGVARLRGDVTGLLSTLGTDGPSEDPADPATFDDVDDFAAIGPGAARLDSARAGSGTVAFRVSFSATYAQPGTFAPSASPTTAKVVTVTVEEAGPGRDGRPPVRVTTPIRITPAKQFLHN